MYGDIQLDGYVRFDPVNTNIDQSISASYIYVSGSTNDLYFTQNGSGYNNTTRLRWLEGGSLYTGILRGGIISSTPGSTTFNISSGSGLIVTLNASTGSEPYPVVKYVSWPTYTAQPIQYSGSAKITYLGIDNTGGIIQQTVPWGTFDINQWDNSIALGVVLHLSGSVSTGVFNSPQISYGPNQKQDDFFRAFGPLKISGHTLQASGSTLSITKAAGTSYREGANYAINPSHPSTVVENSISVSKIYRYYLSGSTPIIDTGVGNAGYTTIDPTKHVDTTTGTLVTVNNGQYSLQRVFWIPNSPTNAFLVYYGNAKYNSLVDAVNAQYTEQFAEAPNTATNAIFIGYIAVNGGTTSLTNATDAAIIQSGLFRSINGIGASGTNYVSTTLAGLADASISGVSKGDLLVYGAAGDSQWNNSKQLTGSYGLTGSLIVTQNISASSFTGSLLGTAATASYVTGSIFTNANSAASASYAVTASHINPLNQSVLITGSFIASGSHTIIGNTTITGSLTTNDGVNVQTITASVVSASSFTGSLLGTASYALNAQGSAGDIQFRGSAAGTLAASSLSGYFTWLETNNNAGNKRSGSLNIGPPVPNGQSLANNPLSVSHNINDYAQMNMQNLSAGNAASSDIIATADNGSDTTNYVNLGINSSTYNQAAYNIGGPDDSYLVNVGGNLTIGTDSAKDLIFHTNGSTTSNERMRITSTGVTRITGSFIASGSTHTLIGNVTITGSLTTNDGVHITSLTASFVSASQFTGSLHGTSSWATSALTASYSTTLGASLSSPANNQVRLLSSNGATLSTVTVNNVTSASYADTASYASNANQLNGQLGSYYQNANNINAGTLGNAYLPTAINVTSVTASFTGSLTGALTGTASWATSALTASYSTTLGASLTSPANNQVRLLSSNGATLSTLTVNNVASASYADTASRMNVTDTTSGTGPYYVAFTQGTTGNQAVLVDSTGLTFNATTNTLTVTASYASSGGSITLGQVVAVSTGIANLF